MSYNLIALRSLEHTQQPLVVAVVVVSALVIHVHTGCALSSVKEGG